jgi:hypothetical protein
MIVPNIWKKTCSKPPTSEIHVHLDLTLLDLLLHLSTPHLLECFSNFFWKNTSTQLNWGERFTSVFKIQEISLSFHQNCHWHENNAHQDPI